MDSLIAARKGTETVREIFDTMVVGKPQPNESVVAIVACPKQRKEQLKESLIFFGIPKALQETHAEGCTVLHVAAAEKKAEQVKSRAQTGAVVNAKYLHKRRLLHYAAKLWYTKGERTCLLNISY